MNYFQYLLMILKLRQMTIKISKLELNEIFEICENLYYVFLKNVPK